MTAVTKPRPEEGRHAKLEGGRTSGPPLFSAAMYYFRAPSTLSASYCASAVWRVDLNLEQTPSRNAWKNCS
jgi:hypothetical protein